MSIMKKKQTVHNLVLRLDVDDSAVVLTMFHEDEEGNRAEDEEEQVYRYKYKNDAGRKDNIKNCIILIADIRQADKNEKRSIYIPKNASELRHYIKNRSLIINNLYLHDKDRQDAVESYEHADLPNKAVLSEGGISISSHRIEEDDEDEDDEKGNDLEKERKEKEQDLSNQIKYVKKRKKELHHSHHKEKEKSVYTKTF